MAKKKTDTQAHQSELPAKYLRQIANCLAYLAVQTDDLKSKQKGDLMLVLASFGFDNDAIASVLDSTPESVSARRSQLKAETKGKKRKISADESERSLTEPE
jgi:hypothetical protein